MLDGIDNLIEVSLRLNKSTPIFQKIQEIPGIARTPRSWREQRSGNGPIYYMIEDGNRNKFLYLEYFMQQI